MMNERLKVSSHAGKNVVIADYTGLKFEEILPLIEDSKNFILSCQPDSVLLMDIVNDVKVNSRVISALKKCQHEIKGRLSKYCVIGASGLTKITLTALRALKLVEIESFNTELEGLEYLKETEKSSV